MKILFITKSFYCYEVSFICPNYKKKQDNVPRFDLKQSSKAFSLETHFTIKNLPLGFGCYWWAMIFLAQERFATAQQDGKHNSSWKKMKVKAILIQTKILIVREWTKW